MNREFLNEAINLFDTPEKWDSFIELSNKRLEIRHEWFNKAKIAIVDYFINNTVENWSFENWNTWDYKWFLKDYGKQSLCIWMYGNRIQLWLDGNCFDSTKATELLNTERYSSLLSVIRPDELFQNDFKLVEYGNFYFDSLNDGNFTDEKLAWYAGNKTEEFVNQIAEKVNRIRKNPELTELLRELNEKCKRE